MICPKIMNTILKVLCDLGPELMFVQSEDCLSIRTASPNHLIIAEAKLPRSTFQKYAMNIDEPIFSVDSKPLSKILSRVNLHPIEFNFKGGKMIVTISQPYRRRFSCITKRQDKRLFHLRDKGLPIIGAISSKHFYEIIADASTIGDELGIQVSGRYLVFRATGDLSNFTSKMPLDRRTEYGHTAMVMISILRTLSPVARDCDFVEIGIDRNSPLLMEFRSKKQPVSFRCIISTRRHKSSQF